LANEIEDPDSDKIKVQIKVVKVQNDNAAPLKYRLWSWLRAHPHERKRGFLRKAAVELNIDYKQRKNVLYIYSSKFKTDVQNLTDFGKAPRSVVSPSQGLVKSKPDSQHACFAIATTPECLDRKKFRDVECLALEAGWRLSKNKNRELIWEKNLNVGRIRWWTTGHVRVHVERPQTLSKAKQLLFGAFVDTGLIDSIKISETFLTTVEWHGHHDNFETDHNLPYMRITAYNELGLKSLTLGDHSHRRDVEAVWVKAPIIEKYEKLVGLMTTVFETSELEKKGIADILQQSNELIVAFNGYLKQQEGRAKEQPKRLYE